MLKRTFVALFLMSLSIFIAPATAQDDAAAEIASLRAAIDAREALENGDDDLALLLSIEAYRLSPTYEAQDILLTSLQTRPQLTRHLFTADEVMTVALSADGSTLVSASNDGAIALWNTTMGEQTATFEARRGAVGALVLSGEGTQFVTGGEASHSLMWDLDSDTSSEFGPNRIITLAFFPENGTDVAVSSCRLPEGAGVCEGRLTTYSVILPYFYFNELEVHDTPTPINSLAVFSDGYLAAGRCERIEAAVCLGAVVDRLSWAGPRAERLFRNEALRNVRTLTISPDGNLVVATGINNVAVVWNMDEETFIGEPRSGYEAIFNSDGTLALHDADGGVRLWDLSGGDWQRIGDTTFTTPDTLEREGIDMAFAGNILATAGCAEIDRLAFECLRGEIRLWDTSITQRLGQPVEAEISDPAAGEGIDNVVTSANGERTAYTFYGSDTPGGDTQVIIMGADNRRIGVPFVIESAIAALAISPDGSTFAAAEWGMWGSQISLWRINAQERNGEPFGQYMAGIHSLAFSPDGSTLASGTETGEIMLWDAETHELLNTLRGHTGFVDALAFNEDGTILASGGRDGSLRLWHVETGRQLGEPLAESGGPIEYLSFGANDELISGGQDADSMRWLAGPDAWVELACHIANRNLTEREWAYYFGDAPYRETCVG